LMTVNWLIAQAVVFEKIKLATSSMAITLF
jgi:hypothetical protein